MKFNLTQPRVLRQPDAVACTLAGELLAGQLRKGWADAWLSPAIDMKIQAVMKCKQCVHLQGENIRNRAPSRQNKAWNCPLWLQYTAVTAVGVKELSHARWLHSLHWHERMIDRSVWNSNNFNSRSWSHVCPRFFEQAIRDVQSAWKGQNLGSAPTMMLSCRSEESHTIRNHVCFKPQPSSEKRRCQ